MLGETTRQLWLSDGPLDEGQAVDEPRGRTLSI